MVSSSLLAQALEGRDLYVWSQNLDFEVYKKLLDNALTKAQPRYGVINLKSVDEPNYIRAFERLNSDQVGFDLLISASSSLREENLIPVYFPLDRGLLGVRMCLINPASQDLFVSVNKNIDFERLSIEVVLDESWPDTTIMRHNKIPVVTLNTAEARLDYAQQNTNVCYSRSLFEIQQEQANNPDLIIERHIVLVYPQADILYFRKGAEDLAEALRYGLQQSYLDGSFQQIYTAYFQEIKNSSQLYSRKILFLNSPLLSSESLSTINQYGIFSFINSQ